MSTDPSGSSSDQPALGLDAAYAVESPEDNRRLYAQWADTYETDFIEAKAYVYHQKVAAAFVTGRADLDAPVLDVGCGTGVVGQELARLGMTAVDGVDISSEMLAHAAAKAVYRALIEADLTKTVPIEDGQYAGVISAGAFTHGHLGPAVLAELLRLGRPGARYTLGINRAHFESMGFADRFERYVEAGIIVDYVVVEADIYADGDDTDDDTDDDTGDDNDTANDNDTGNDNDDDNKDPNHLAAIAVFDLPEA